MAPGYGWRIRLRSIGSLRTLTTLATPSRARQCTTYQARCDTSIPPGFPSPRGSSGYPQSYFINSANTASNDGWTTLGLRAEYAVGSIGRDGFRRGRKSDRHRYSASVQVDNAAGQSFEPADGRAFYAGFRWSR